MTGTTHDGTEVPVDTTTDQQTELLLRWKVILLNDDVTPFYYVVDSAKEMTALIAQEACKKTLEAHKAGASLLPVSHRERAELYQQQFASLLPPIGIALEPAD
jgi:ATP-dependent Clp protease adapter protein ClpS